MLPDTCTARDALTWGSLPERTSPAVPPSAVQRAARRVLRAVKVLVPIPVGRS
ncbi:hypothetical protein Ae263Ps1_6193c [Pseudonocardia sp. Ae263_Ps1]|nr:hypothetical protein Ae263Ps1_6193c [Pseudonocardia sp. Ae263_Ps1]